MSEDKPKKLLPNRREVTRAAKKMISDLFFGSRTRIGFFMGLALLATTAGIDALQLILDAVGTVGAETVIIPLAIWALGIILQILANIGWGLWFMFLGVGFMNPRTVVISLIEIAAIVGVNFGEAIFAVRALPLFTIGMVIIIILVRLEDALVDVSRGAESVVLQKTAGAASAVVGATRGVVGSKTKAGKATSAIPTVGSDIKPPLSTNFQNAT